MHAPDAPTAADPAARALNQAEMSSRAPKFVAALSGSIVAIAFVAQATDFGSETAAFASMLLPVVLFLGLTTFIRAVDLSAEEVRWVAALDRARSAYAEAVPGLDRYFLTRRDRPQPGRFVRDRPARRGGDIPRRPARSGPLRRSGLPPRHGPGVTPRGGLG